MKYGVCSFSGQTIHKGKGRILVVKNGSSFLLGNSKNRKYFTKGMNPKQLSWTLSSRIARGKAVAFKTTKVQTKKTEKSIRSFVGLSLEELKSKMSTDNKEDTTAVRFNKKDKIRNAARTGQ